MFNLLNLHTHGELRVSKIKVNHGKEAYHRREKFCAKHGWVDVFAAGGDEVWHKLHRDCDKTEHHGAAFVPAKVMAKAA